ncbi:MAG: hypothetical protein IPO92_16460 [Saprospiraceae bacterium]|nr:hypothetical protein [Saprospiraceae bacterium]
MNYDKNVIDVGENNGFARYANLPPGDYTFQMSATNADGILNNKTKEIDIKILPPFWRTWWFRLLVLLSAFGSSYLLIRSKYKRRLEKQNQLLREQALIIENQQAIEHERTRIASEMHDDLGAGLTTIRYLSDKALIQAKDETEKVQIAKISDHSNALVRNMSEIIWALNSRFDTTENLVGYLRRYVVEYLEEHNMLYKFIVEHGDQEIPISGEKRRNIFLVLKKVLHNSIKYAEADSIEINVAIGKELTITIFERGSKGFDPKAAIDKGNGIYNIQKRMHVIKGSIAYHKEVGGMLISMTCPLTQSS